MRKPYPAEFSPTENNLAQLLNHFVALYGENEGRRAFNKLIILAGVQSNVSSSTIPALDQGTVVLITYGDQVQATGSSPLGTLAGFCRRWLSEIVDTIHILPFFPYSSDDGFSVIDYLQVDPGLGEWSDIQAMRQDFRLMFDLVINHTSASHAWFKSFLQGEEPYSRYYLTVDGQPDLKAVTRPRSLPLLTGFQARSGEKMVWTTFSQDQVDLDFSNPDVLLEILQILMSYIARGAEFIRLDAIGYLWKEIGTACIHLPQTHRVVKLLRSFLNMYAPGVRLVSETNVPHAENISYFGDGRDEAQLVYNFALPPLTLHAFHTGDVRVLSQWAASLHLPSDQVTFFNFLASHDGIGVTPARDLLSPASFHSLVESSTRHGGQVSYKNNPNGSRSPYELNINYFDALSDPNLEEPTGRTIDRFIAAHAILFCLVGVPGIYFHSLFGSRSWQEGVELTGRSRSINRQKLDVRELEDELRDINSLRSRVFNGLSSLLRIRASQPAFDPHGRQRLLDVGQGTFAVFRAADDPLHSILCLQNVRAEETHCAINPGELWEWPANGLMDLVSGSRYAMDKTIQLNLSPYQTCWLGIAEAT